MSNAEFPQSYGVPAPGTPKGSYPVTIAELVQGGLHVVPNESDMLLILPQFREEGMEVNVLSTQRKYRLINNPDTEYTQFSDWKYIPDGINMEELNLLLQNEGLSNLVDKLLANLKNYLKIVDARETYFDKKTIIQYYQTIEGMRNYVTREEFQRVLIALSKVVSRVIPLDILRVYKGTDINDIDLPTNVIVYYGDANAEPIPVLWNKAFYDPELIGYQIIEGKLYLPDRVDTNTYPNVVKCHQIIQVMSDEVIEKPTEYVISNFIEPSNIKAAAGTELRSIALPATVTAVLVDNYGFISNTELNVTWDYTPFEDVFLKHGVIIYGDVTIDDDTGIDNALKLRPQIVIKATGSNAIPIYRFETEVILKAGDTSIESNSTNMIDHIYTSDFYGCGNDTSQRLAEIRFCGIVDDNNRNLTPNILERYPNGIRMPVFTSNDEDVAAYLSVIKSFNTSLGYPLEYEVPGGIFHPKVALDDETHRIVFGSAVLHNCRFLIRKSSNVNLLYPDIC